MDTSKGKIRNIILYFIVTFAIVFVIGITRNFVSKNNKEIEGYSTNDTIDIAILYTPGSLFLYNDSISGINSKIAESFATQTGTPLKIWPVTDITDAMNKTEEGAFDVLASLPLDKNFKEKFLTSDNVFLDKLVLVQLVDSITGFTKVSNPLELDGKTVSIVKGSSAFQRLQNLSKEIGGKIEINQVDGISEDLLCLQVANGSIPLAVVNNKVAEQIAKKYPLMYADNPISFTQFQVWLFNKADTIFYNNFNDWLSGFKKTETYKEIIEKF